MRIAYTLLVGLPLCVMLMTIGCLLCLTVIGIPVGLALFVLGHRVVALQ